MSAQSQYFIAQSRKTKRFFVNTEFNRCEDLIEQVDHRNVPLLFTSDQVVHNLAHEFDDRTFWFQGHRKDDVVYVPVRFNLTLGGA